MIIAVLSGKGGTGKTTVALNLARSFGTPVQLLDCDVEEPNAHLFLPGEVRCTESVSVPVPKVDEAKCDACGKCSEICQFNAIISLKTKPLVFSELCHSCGGCALVCPQKAISEVPKFIGLIETIKYQSIFLIQGRLNVGVAMSPPLIKEVKLRLLPNMPVILDAPPGTSCPVITTVKDADVAVLVTEPTPFGLHDLELAVEMVKEIGPPFGVVVNRVGIGDDRVHEYCEKNRIPILAEIPDDRQIAEAYSRGEIIVDVLPRYRKVFENLLISIKKLAKKEE